MDICKDKIDYGKILLMCGCDVNGVFVLVFKLVRILRILGGRFISR